jgi:small subunit ribosomal protein S16
MLKIKLTRLGKKGEPRYRIVVNEARDKRDGQYVAKIGHYHPAAQPKLLNLDLEAYQKWLACGAQPTSTVAFLAEIAKTGKGFGEKKKSLSKKAKAKLKDKETPPSSNDAPADEKTTKTAKVKDKETPPSPKEESTKQPSDTAVGEKKE